MLLKCLSESEWLHWWLFSQVSKCNFEAICLHLQKKLSKCQLFTYARTGYVRQSMSQYRRQLLFMFSLTTTAYKATKMTRFYRLHNELRLRVDQNEKKKLEGYI